MTIAAADGSDPPAVVYSYAPGRGADHAIALLKGFAGILQTDGYGAYKTLVAADRARGAITLAHCWAHARRRFFELAKGGAAPIADEALRRIAGLYAIEAEIRGQDADIRKATRQARSRPLVLDLKLWLEAQLTTVAGRSPHGRGDPLQPRALGGAHPLSRRRPHRARTRTRSSGPSGRSR